MADHAHSDSAAVQAQLDRLTALSPGRDVLGLERIAALCQRLGHPERQLPRSFHIAGTNGKGSTSAFLRAILESTGRRVHVYSSPHLVRFNERIRISGQLIDDALLAALLAEVLDVAEGLAPSFFEVTTAAAFLAFARHPADDAIIEVGLGGRLDATNIIPAPAVCGIASLGIDHEGFLLAAEDGVPDLPPIARIAWEKSGIIKPLSRIVTQKYPQNVAAIIDAKARQMAVEQYWTEGRDWWVSADDVGFRWHAPTGGIARTLYPALAGAHQWKNAGLAIAMARAAPGFVPDDDAIASGVAAARWPARLQRLQLGLLHDIAAPSPVWIDGGHNVDAAYALADFMAKKDAQFTLVMGMLANKDAAQFLQILAPHIACCIAVPIVGHEHHDPQTICAFAKHAGIPDCRTAGDITHALRLAHKSVDSRPILIGGSLYLAGQALSANAQLPD